MTAPRIAPLEEPYPPEVREDFEKLMPQMEPLKLFRTLAHNPRVLRRVRRGGLLDRGSIGPREREIVILRTCARCDAEYEWGVHVAFFAEKAGLREDQVRATVRGDAADPAWTGEESLLVRLADELHETAGLSEELWGELRRHWEENQLVELMVLAGFYHAVSYVVNGVGVELEDYAARFPDASPEMVVGSK